MVTKNKLNLAILMTGTALLLSACAGGEPAATTDQSPTTSITDTASRSDKSALYGDRRENLTTLASLYKRSPKDEFVAGRYAKTLRESGDYKKAENVLQPFVRGKNPATLTYTEMGALELETGDLKSAENYARKAIKVDNGNYRAWHILGIALDAQLAHPEAETAFRKALALWQGDKIPVMNNLALNLAAQGYTDQALQLLYDAKAQDSSRVEIERNIRIIRTLNEPSAYDTNLPGMKGVKPQSLPKKPAPKPVTPAAADPAPVSKPKA